MEKGTEGDRASTFYSPGRGGDQGPGRISWHSDGNSSGSSAEALRRVCTAAAGKWRTGCGKAETSGVGKGWARTGQAQRLRAARSSSAAASHEQRGSYLLAGAGRPHRLIAAVARCRLAERQGLHGQVPWADARVALACRLAASQAGQLPPLAAGRLPQSQHGQPRLCRHQPLQPLLLRLLLLPLPHKVVEGADLQRGWIRQAAGFQTARLPLAASTPALRRRRRGSGAEGRLEWWQVSAF